MTRLKPYPSLIFFALCIVVGQATAACTISSLPIMFGNYDVFSVVPLDSTTTITVNCDQKPPPRVDIAIGPSTYSGGFVPRQMKQLSGADLLEYNLYTQANRTTIWGDGSGTTLTVNKKVNRKKPWNAVVYGRIPAGQDISVGQYNDSLLVTIIF